MASTLHSVTPLQLSDSFNEWYLRSNDLIDVVNRVNVYDVVAGFGFAEYRAVDGTKTLRINIGQGNTEYQGTLSGVTGQGIYGLRFLDDPSATGANNPDVSTSHKVLAVDIAGLPDATPGPTGSVEADDYFMFADVSTATADIRRVKASELLPYSISGDHRFTGNIYFDGTYTVINSSELFVDDKVIYLGTSGDSDGGEPGLNDVNIDGAGVVVRGISGDKEWIVDTSNAGISSAYQAWKSNIGIDFNVAKAYTNSFNIFGYNSAETKITISHDGVADERFEIGAFKSGDTQKRIRIGYTNSQTGATADGIRVTRQGTVQIPQLNGDMIVSGITFENSFSYIAKNNAVPTSSSAGAGNTYDAHIHYKWTNRKVVEQTAHGFTSGDLLKFYSNTAGATYDKADNSTPTNAEVVAIVEKSHSPNHFTAVYTGLVDLSEMPSIVSGGFTLAPGEAYFLGATAGSFTETEPTVAGRIRKPVLIGVTGDTGLFVNYIGNEVQVDTGQSFDFVTYDAHNLELVDQRIVTSSFRNKIINGDFDFWQRWRDYDSITGTQVTGAINLPTGNDYGTTLEFGEGVTGYHADMWAILSSEIDPVNTRSCVVHKLGHTGDNAIKTVGGTTPRSYIRVESGPSGSGNVILSQRIENVRTLGSTTGENEIILSYWIRGTSMDGGSTDFKVNVVQVFDGSTYDAGSTNCFAINGSVTSVDGTTFDVTSDWQQKQNRFRTNELNTFSSSINADKNWLEVQFILPSSWDPGVGFDLSRVQLESGTNRSRFEERPLSIEKQLCERYYAIADVSFNGYFIDGSTASSIVKLDAELYPSIDVHGISGSVVGSTVLANDFIANGTLDALSLSDVTVSGSSVFAQRGASGSVNYLSSYHIDSSIR